jgi:6-phosphofructokinase 1
VETLLSEVEAVYRRLGRVVIAMSEGARDQEGESLGRALKGDVDVFGHKMKGGASDEVARLITAEMGLKARVDKPNYLQRSSMGVASRVDLEEAYEVGRAAVRAAVAGETGQMISLVRLSSTPYEFTTGLTPLSEVANRERPLPPEYIDRETGEITSGFIDRETGEITSGFAAYAKPLIGDPLPPYFRLPALYVERPHRGNS